MYELIAGQPPLQSTSTYDLLNAHMHQVPRPLAELRTDIPISLSDAVAKALEKEPSRRFPSASAFGAALCAHVSEELAETLTSYPVTSWQRAGTDELNRPTTLTTNLDTVALERHLASFIGPIAKIVVARMAKQTRDLDQMYAEAAKQIERDSDRQAFLRNRPR